MIDSDLLMKWLLFNLLFRKFMRQILREGNRHRARIIINKVCWSELSLYTSSTLVLCTSLHCSSDFCHMYSTGLLYFLSGVLMILSRDSIICYVWFDLYRHWLCSMYMCTIAKMKIKNKMSQLLVTGKHQFDLATYSASPNYPGQAWHSPIFKPVYLDSIWCDCWGLCNWWRRQQQSSVVWCSSDNIHILLYERQWKLVALLLSPHPMFCWCSVCWLSPWNCVWTITLHRTFHARQNYRYNGGNHSQ